MNLAHLTHAHRVAQTNDIKITITQTPMYLQIDGEAWLIEKKCSLQIKLYDQVPTLIGYKFPRGVYPKYESDYYTHEIKKARWRYRNTVRMKYGIPDKITKDYDPKKPSLRRQSTDDFYLNIRLRKQTPGRKKFGNQLAVHSHDDQELKLCRSSSDNGRKRQDAIHIKVVEDEDGKKWPSLFGSAVKFSSFFVLFLII